MERKKREVTVQYETTKKQTTLWFHHECNLHVMCVKDLHEPKDASTILLFQSNECMSESSHFVLSQHAEIMSWQGEISHKCCLMQHISKTQITGGVKCFIYSADVK